MVITYSVKDFNPRDLPKHNPRNLTNSFFVGLFHRVLQCTTTGIVVIIHGRCIFKPRTVLKVFLRKRDDAPFLKKYGGGVSRKESHKFQLTKPGVCYVSVVPAYQTVILTWEILLSVCGSASVDSSVFDISNYLS